MPNLEREWSLGARWHRWDPHIHAPGTLKNDLFKDDWDSYFSALEEATPAVRALGITDYCVLDSYREFLDRRGTRLPKVDLVFPNIEFRLDIQAKSGSGVNLHLLFSPDGEDHISEIERVLREFSFGYRRDNYRCTKPDLMRLGRAHSRGKTADEGALVAGISAFKLNLNDLRTALKQNQWFRNNCVIAIAGGKDGTSGLSADDFSALRVELESFVDVIFSGNPSDRNFWLGRKGGMGPQFLSDRYGGRKPCLHGCDAHKLDDVLRPDLDRYCWIRSELSFSGLKQVILEPELRVWIGAGPPPWGAPEETISSISIRQAPWFKPQECRLNGGLVAIIGPRGSGKTAFADVVARTAGAPIRGSASFLEKAKDKLDRAEARILFDEETPEAWRALVGRSESANGTPQVQYLSQQFVERLCSANGVTDELLKQIEAVVFNALPNEMRMTAHDFDELRSLRTFGDCGARDELQNEIIRLTDAISDETKKIERLPTRENELKELRRQINRLKKKCTKLIDPEKKKEHERLGKLKTVLQARQQELESLNRSKELLVAVRRRLSQFANATESRFAGVRNEFEHASLTEEEWDALAPTMPPPSEILDTASQRVETKIKAATEGKTDLEIDAGEFASDSLERLTEKRKGLEKEVGLQQKRAKELKRLSRQIDVHEKQLKLRMKEIADLRKAGERRSAAVVRRRNAYREVFESVDREVEVLRDLYSPLAGTLRSGAATGLSFEVRRIVALDDWADQGEALLDLRKAGKFRGRGNLAEAARVILESAWMNGDASQVASQMQVFITEYGAALRDSRADGVSPQDIGRWLFSTDHIRIEYVIEYEGVEVSKLSPGMRGVVLLILFLHLDQWDTRPLIIDQPEENLDPHTVYEQLVHFFREAKRRRQVILVTHNANLVVNTDADQVIVANATRHTSGELPLMEYTAGALEDDEIREKVCEILEGGRQAFHEREVRYRLSRPLLAD